MSGTGTYLDGLDDRDRPKDGLDEKVGPELLMPETEPEVDVPVAPVHVAPGIPVDMAVHGEAFKRKSFGIHRVPGTDLFARDERTWSWPIAPETPCRDALSEEVPDAAKRCSIYATASGYTPRTTFARSGSERTSPDRGRCRCGALVLLYKETGYVRPHRTPEQPEKVPCTGTGLDPLGECRLCNARVKTLKSGALARHYLKAEPVMCDNAEQPDEVVPGEPLPGKSSVVLRIPGLGVASWIEGKFDVAYLLDGKGGVREVGAEEFKTACTKERME